jgi:hypothetical protein
MLLRWKTHLGKHRFINSSPMAHPSLRLFAGQRIDDTQIRIATRMSLVLLRQNVAGADMAGSKELLGEFVLKTLRSRYAVPVVDIPSA